MFCKKCGKEIPNDAHFCTYCGTNQGGNNHEYVTRLAECVKKFVKKHRRITGIYFVWALLHLCLYIFSSKGGSSYSYAINTFYPFRCSFSEMLQGDGRFSIMKDFNSYDFSELFFYTIIFPLVIYGLVKIVPRCFRYCKSLSGRKRRS